MRGKVRISGVFFFLNLIEKFCHTPFSSKVEFISKNEKEVIFYMKIFPFYFIPFSMSHYLWICEIFNFSINNGQKVIPFQMVVFGCLRQCFIFSDMIYIIQYTYMMYIIYKLYVSHHREVADRYFCRLNSKSRECRCLHSTEEQKVAKKKLRPLCLVVPARRPQNDKGVH